ncbi:hypothetical protein Fcan01_18876 [Folsomia candida]|uniref:Uncharacterized protein n=1 Tax=Folsomia candida TaxID=158441 RepID=A0A226DMQ9_FOLCA|nr:hypothetical protein Fcan01_18876 [Folsomia candida]
MAISAKFFLLVVTSGITGLLAEIPPKRVCYQCTYEKPPVWNWNDADCYGPEMKPIYCDDFVTECFVDRVRGRGCQIRDDSWPRNHCDDQTCTCETDFCNGPELRPKGRRNKGLTCNVCTGRAEIPPEGRDWRWTPLYEYFNKQKYSGNCTNFTEEAQQDEKHQAKCPDEWRNPFCYLHKKFGGGCDSADSTAFYLDDLPHLVGQCNDVGCNCDDADLCNGPLLRGVRP